MGKLDKQQLLEIKELILKEIKMFDPKLKKLSLQELEQYYFNKRKEEYENGISIDYLEARKRLQPILLKFVKLDRIFSMEFLKIIKDERTPTDRPIIYACTHIGGNDIQRFFEAIKNHTYLFLGDPKELYRDISGLLLNLNGVVSFETENKPDRKIARSKSIELLKQNGRLILCPEGAWNITHNLPCMKLYSGTIKMAIETNAIIVPIAIEQYEKKFYVNIGKNIDVNNTPNIGIDILNEYLRDTLATLKWEIWESQKEINRKNISQEYIDNFKQNIVDRCPYGFTIDDVENGIYKDPNIIEEQEVFEPIKRITLKSGEQMKNTKTYIKFD